MVLAGQYLERPALVRCGELTLEGLYHRGARPPALLLCPPVSEGGMDAPPLAELAWACARSGHGSLRFQHRGRGASEGARDPSRAAEDALAALAHLEATVPGPLAVAGLGSGCETALAVLRARPWIRCGLLVAPARVPEAAGIGARLLALLPEEGAAVPPAPWPGWPGAAARVPGSDATFRSGLTAMARMAIEHLEG